jgi:two-component system chemotaxis response regulator CheY
MLHMSRRHVTEVLVVDDEVAVLQTIADALTDEGYAVVTARNGALALQRVRDRRPDVVLLDLMMPVMDGWTFLRLCRTDPGCADVPVVVLSAVNHMAITSLQADAFVAKPFDLGDLLAAVERLAAA